MVVSEVEGFDVGFEELVVRLVVFVVFVVGASMLGSITPIP